jgi:radical SAM protein with 4Fe4S-binding SPASM domain
MAEQIESVVERQIQHLEQFIHQKEYLRASHPLRYLFWESTLRCNMRCLHCGSDCVCDNSTQADELDVGTIQAELRSIAQVYEPSTITFAIIGGEPLVRKDDVCEVGTYAAELGYHWGIVTNGLLLNDEATRQIERSGLQTISISLDGLEREHDALRNRPGAFRLATSAIECLLAKRFFRKFDVICCVNKLNIDKLAPFVDHLRQLQVPAVRFTPIFSHGRATRHPELILDREDYLQLLQFIAAQREKQTDIRINLSEEGYWGPEWEGRVRDNLHYCGSGIVIGTMLYNGDVIGCPSMSRAFVEGNIKDAPFVDIWQRRFSRYREGRRALFAAQCGDCEHWVLCEGGGLHLLDQTGVVENQCCLAKVA